MAGWLGLGGVTVGDRGDLVGELGKRCASFAATSTTRWLWAAGTALASISVTTAREPLPPGDNAAAGNRR